MSSSFTLIIAISVAFSILAAIIGMRTTWMAGSFFNRSRVNVSNPGPAPTVTPVAAAPAQRSRTPEERLADLQGLKARGVIDEAEYNRSREAVLQQITKA